MTRKRGWTRQDDGSHAYIGALGTATVRLLAGPLWQATIYPTAGRPYKLKPMRRQYAKVNAEVALSRKGAS